MCSLHSARTRLVALAGNMSFAREGGKHWGRVLPSGCASLRFRARPRVPAAADRRDGTRLRHLFVCHEMTKAKGSQKSPAIRHI